MALLKMTIYKVQGFVFRFPIKIALPEMEWSATPWRKRATLKTPNRSECDGGGSAELVVLASPGKRPTM